MHPREMIDSHVHFWDPQNLDYPWLATVSALRRAYLPQEYANDSAGANVSKMIFVECGCNPKQTIEEVQWVSKLALSEQRLRGIVAGAALERGLDVDDELAALAQFPLVKGVRRNFEDEDVDFCLRPDFITGARAVARFNFSLDVCVRHIQLPSVIQLVRACPEVRFVLDHCGKPDICHQLFDPWREHIVSLSKLPNVSCKISGLLTEARRKQWQPDDFKPYILHVLESFGADRVMVGGDWPVINLGGKYPEWCEVLQHCLDAVDAQTLVKLYQTNAEKFYRLNP